ncbi:hypothetical protein CDAR_583491 [Caerostris darwini]|uniref:Uncharacterized protein n=1 Tax=Caerostris darwini TaxID=1538125 RepID=A0AAV4PTI0_9ARAC|nr:hypothetical protein CDAR_583491 [Caerostris darwini]
MLLQDQLQIMAYEQVYYCKISFRSWHMNKYVIARSALDHGIRTEYTIARSTSNQGIRPSMLLQGQLRIMAYDRVCYCKISFGSCHATKYIIARSASDHVMLWS